MSAVPGERRKTVFVTPDLHRRLKLYTVAKGRSMQEAAEEAITRWLDENEKEDGRSAQG